MKKRFLGAIAALAVAALAAGAVPAFTADNGTITVTITAQAPVAPCLTVTPGAVDFGTLPFSAPPNALSSGTANVEATNCGTADEHLTVVGSNPSGPGGAWTLSDESGDLCANAPLDTVYVHTQFEGSSIPIATTPRTIADRFAMPIRFPPGVAKVGELELHMPCQGSNGSGETKTFSVTYTAVVE